MRAKPDTEFIVRLYRQSAEEARDLAARMRELGSDDLAERFELDAKINDGNARLWGGAKD